MVNRKKWSEQVLIKATLVNEHDKSAKTSINCLQVCNTGSALYRKHFIEGKWKDKIISEERFDFIVIMNDYFTKGAFYEVELANDYGKRVKMRGLVEVANPSTDIPIIIAAMKKFSFIPKEKNIQHVKSRKDIHMVEIGRCRSTLEGVAFYKTQTLSPFDGSQEMSLLEYCQKYKQGQFTLYMERRESIDISFLYTSDMGADTIPASDITSV